MAASNEQRISLPVPPGDVWRRVQDVVAALPGAHSVELGHGVVTASVGTGFSSWGEKVVVRVGEAPGGTDVHIVSRCSFRLQLVDWGKNKRNVRRIAQGLEVPGAGSQDVPA